MVMTPSSMCRPLLLRSSALRLYFLPLRLSALMIEAHWLSSAAAGPGPTATGPAAGAGAGRGSDGGGDGRTELLEGSDGGLDG